MQDITAAQLTRAHAMMSQGYQWLMQQASETGHWNDVRATALAGMALRGREPLQGEWLQQVCRNLEASQASPREGEAFWGEEVWDTSIALQALQDLGHDGEAVQHALAWLERKWNVTGRENWEDDVWDTSWAVVAVLPHMVPQAHAAVNWLQQFCSPEGQLISPHYTAYFVHAASNLLEHVEDAQLQAQVANCVSYLHKELGQERLWSGEPWANGQVLWVLAKTGNLQLDKTKMQWILDWFDDKQVDGCWEDTEDTASILLALHAALVAIYQAQGMNHTTAQQTVFDEARRLYHAPTLCMARPWVEKQADGTYSLHMTRKRRQVLYWSGAALGAIITWSVAGRDFVEMVAGLL